MTRRAPKRFTLKVKKKLNVRKHANHHCKNLAKPSSKKDIATPVTPQHTAIARMRQRLRRANDGCAFKLKELPLNNGIRAALRANKGQRPEGVDERDWAKRACKAKDIPDKVAGDVSWDALRRRVSVLSSYQYWCTKCDAADNRSCYCGASLVTSCDIQTITGFFDYVRHPSNPLWNALDPQDQQRLVACMDVCAKYGAKRVLSELQEIRLAANICLYLSLVACDASMPYVCEALMSMDLKNLSKSIESVPDGKLYRPGQRPFAKGKKGLAQFIVDFNNKKGAQLSHALMQLKKARGRESRHDASRKIMSIVVHEPQHGFGKYRQKRYLELIVLAGACGFGGIIANDSDWDRGIDIFPVAGNTADGIKSMFPAATNEHLQRQALKLLCRMSAHHGARMTVARMAALVCFHCKETSGSMTLIKKQPSEL